ncbi:GTPase [Aureococcus anophagefferens]|nr:GTPase [Aureococcus anophagefferens]
MSSTKKRPPSGAELVALWRQPRRSRAICVLGHVDHGKSSLVDWLLAENGHIPARLAGTLRYLDDTVDEQERGITMRASAITILHRRVGPPPQAWETGDKGDRDYAITLVDSPGHIDFSHDACAATRLSDGAVIVVDVVEGVRVQTRFALRAACAERLAPILVLNKLDRLAVETADSPMEAFLRLRRVLENANAALHRLCACGCGGAFAARAAFAAEKGNVVFASALDGWGFTALQVAKVLLPRFPNDAEALACCSGTSRDGDKVKRLRDPSYPDDAIFPTLVLAPLFQLLTGTALDDLGPCVRRGRPPLACVAKNFSRPGSDAVACAVRVLSGTLRAGAALRVGESGAAVVVDAVSAMMGGELVPIDEARAGCVACLGPGVAAALGELKRATLADPSLDGALAAPAGATALPLVRVAVAAQKRASARLDRGLRLLQALDAAATVEFRNDGEKVVGCVGELHLDQALRDLRAYCGGDEAIALDVSEPIVGFREVWRNRRARPASGRRPGATRTASPRGRKTFADDWPSGAGAGVRGRRFGLQRCPAARSPARTRSSTTRRPSTSAAAASSPGARARRAATRSRRRPAPRALGDAVAALAQGFADAALAGPWPSRSTASSGAALGFGADLLQWTSGHGTAPQMAFDGFAVMDVDPFWTPTTEDEREEHGDVDDRVFAAANAARQAIAAVRSRKGLAGDALTLDKSAEAQKSNARIKG